MSAFYNAEYPFKSHFLSLNPLGRPQDHLHYIDEGVSSDIVVCVHGNPTWSFYYRKLVSQLKGSRRIIALDNLGCGFSSKPQDYSYRLRDHIENLSFLIESLGLKNIHLVAHDWGGAIALGWAVKNPHLIKSIALSNTAAFLSPDIPQRINILKTPVIGEFLMRRLNLFAWPATFMASKKGLTTATKAAYLWPYQNFHDRVAIARFVQDIPLKPKHQTYDDLAKIERDLPTLKCPKLLFWGLKDFCFHEGFLQRFREIFPDAKVYVDPQAGHYFLEDCGEKARLSVQEFFDECSRADQAPSANSPL